MEIGRSFFLVGICARLLRCKGICVNRNTPTDLSFMLTASVAVALNRRFERWRIVCIAINLAIWMAGVSAFSQVTPSRPDIEKHLDRSIEIYGRYAAVKLPIRNGVPIWNPGPIRVSPQGEIFVANYVGEIYRIIDTDRDGLEDTAVLFCNVAEAGLRYPTTMVFRDRELVVGTTQELRAYEDADGDGKAERSRVLFKFPHSADPQDWTFGLCVGPNGDLYANLSTDSYNPSPAPDPQALRGSLLRFPRDGSEMEKVATGLRFAPGMAFDASGDLFFTDNEGGGNPSEELNIAFPGKFYGHNPAKFSKQSGGTDPFMKLSTARGACSLAFNSSTNDFGGNAGNLFVAFWGIGGLAADGAIGRITLGRDPGGTLYGRETAFGRFPKAYDLVFGPSGDLYVTHFGDTPAPMTPNPAATGDIYRIIPAPWITPQQARPATFPVVRGDAEKGKALFAERGCAQCHAMDGDTELLGPNLARLGALMDYDDALRAIAAPSQNIRAGYEAKSFETTDGELFTGRMISSDLDQVTIMVAGNQMVTLRRSAIRSHGSSSVSFMPEHLLDGLSRGSLHDLFAFLEIREQRFRIRLRHRFFIIALLAGAMVVTTWLLGKATNTRAPVTPPRPAPSNVPARKGSLAKLAVMLILAASAGSACRKNPAENLAVADDTPGAVQTGGTENHSEMPHAWNTFRGSDQGRISPKAKPPLEWSESKNITWKTAIPGSGASSPVVSEDRIWLTTALEEGRSLQVIAVDRHTGKVLVEQRVFDLPAAPPRHRVNSPASPTPVLDGEKLFVSFGAHGVACLNTGDARIVWQNTELKFDDEKMGPGASPILAGNTLVMSCDGTDKRFIAGLDKETGKLIWKTDRSNRIKDAVPYRKAFSTPLFGELNGIPQIISSSSYRLFGYDPASGKELWSADLPGFCPVPVPVVSGDWIYVCTGYNKAELWAFSSKRGAAPTREWKVSRSVPLISSPVLGGQHLYFVSQDGIASCVEAASGDTCWNERLKGAFWASPLYSAEGVYFFAEDGTATVVSAGPKFQVLARNSLDDEIMATPASVENALFLRTRQHLYRIESAPLSDPAKAATALSSTP